MNNAQQELDDEILSACHDGELPSTDSDAVQRRLAREPELADRLQAMQYVDAVAAGAFRARDRQPVPERILELLARAEQQDRERRRETANVVSLNGPGVERPRRRWFAAAAAAAAAVFRRIAHALS